MGKPKDTSNYPVSKGIKFVGKARMWVEYENYNKANVPDKVRWFRKDGTSYTPKAPWD